MKPCLDEMTPAERRKHLHDITARFIVDFYVDEVIAKKQPDFVLDIREFTPIYAPSELDEILQENGWERLDFDESGWQQDTWYWYAHPDYDFQLTMEYSGFYGDLKLYRREKED
jgi:hypothetical protein